MYTVNKYNRKQLCNKIKPGHRSGQFCSYSNHHSFQGESSGNR